MYILVSCCEGNIIVRKYNAYDEAYASMKEEYEEFVADCEECDEYGISSNTAYVTYEFYYRCDWHIEEL